MGKQEVTIEEFRLEDIPLSCTWIVVGPPGSGKCLAPGTPIVMFDGTVKNVENIKIGDLLMGDDSSPRKVLATTTGTDQMYRIKQNKGDDYIVNEPHILVLKRIYTPRISHGQSADQFKVFWMLHNAKFSETFSYAGDPGQALSNAVSFLDSLKEGCDYTSENYLEISVKDYLRMPLHRRRKYRGYRVGVNFGNVSAPANPRLLGMWLIGGDDDKLAILSKGMKMSNVSADWMSHNDKHIPIEFKSAHLQDRLELLAGIIDAGGRLWGNSFYEIIQENERLAKDIAFVARSCGFYVSITECEKTRTGKVNQRIIIRGHDLHKIPVLLLEKDIDFGSFMAVDENTTAITIEALGEGTYYGFEIDGNGRFLLGDFTVTHNTSLMENLCYYHKHKYPVARIFMGTESGYKKFCDIFHPLYVSNYYNEDQEKSHILRQRTCLIENGKGDVRNFAINILDDVSDDPKIYKTKVMKGIFKLGSQHWEQLFMVGSQYAIDMPPDLRKATSYVAIFRDPDEIERKKLYANFGGLAGSYQNFCDLMDQLTGDYTCLIFKKRSQSNKMEECIFYYRTKTLEPWKFGCNEYRQWGKERYNPAYVEKIMM